MYANPCPPSLTMCNMNLILPLPLKLYVHLFHAVKSVFQTFYQELVEQLNPDDITANLYAEKIISVNERDRADNETLTMQKRNKVLLNALERTIDYDTFSKFLNNLDKCDKYKTLVDKIRCTLNVKQN